MAACCATPARRGAARSASCGVAANEAPDGRTLRGLLSRLHRRLLHRRGGLASLVGCSPLAGPMSNRELAVYAVSSLLAALLVVFALHGGSTHRAINFLMPAIWETPE